MYKHTVEVKHMWLTLMRARLCVAKVHRSMTMTGYSVLIRVRPSAFWSMIIPYHGPIHAVLEEPTAHCSNVCFSPCQLRGL